MNEKLELADNLLGVFSDAYTQAIYSGAERDAAFWEDPSGRDGFLIPVEVETVSKWPPLAKPLKRLSLVGMDEAEAEAALIAFLNPPAPPKQRPPFPGRHTLADKRPDLEAGFEAAKQADAFQQNSEPLPATRPALPDNRRPELSEDEQELWANATRSVEPLQPAEPPEPPPPDDPPSATDELPDPRDREAFQKWLEGKPREWSVVIAARAALRVLPLVRRGEVDAHKATVILLPVFRATAIARFAAKYLNGTFAAAASAADDALGTARITTAYIAAADAAGNAAKAASSKTHATVAAAVGAVDASQFTARHDSTAYANSCAVEIRKDALAFREGASAAQLAHKPLWHVGDYGHSFLSARIGRPWLGLQSDLSGLGEHWKVWTDWYDGVLAGSPPSPTRSEAWEAAFTDVQDPSYPWTGPLPWDDGPEAVNLAIKARLDAVLETEKRTANESVPRQPATIVELAEAASPQPSITPEGKLDAGPNPRFDVPATDHDLPSLPIRQRTIIKIILTDLPRNAPEHLKACLHEYDDELKARGVQPILGLLRDMADIVEAAVHAPHASDEWLEAGLRAAFTRFAANHALFLEHFPLDLQREELYQRTPVDEEAAADRTVTKPIEDVAKETHAAHQAGSTTPDFVVVIDKFIELWRVVSTLPPPHLAEKSSANGGPEVKAGPEGSGTTSAVSPRKRTILTMLGFFERAYNLVGTTVTVAGVAGFGGLATALEKAIQALSKLLL